MISAFKAFEVKNISNVLGGQKKCTWVGKDENGNTICDIFDSTTNTESCGQSDSGLSVGETWGYAVATGPIKTIIKL